MRDAAAAEVAVHGLYGNEENGDKASRKRKHMNADEKAKQKYVLYYFPLFNVASQIADILMVTLPLS